jgi:hypothetical protein
VACWNRRMMGSTTKLGNSSYMSLHVTPSALPCSTPARAGWTAARPSICAMPSPASRRCMEAISGFFRDTRAPGAAALGSTEEVALFFAEDGRPGVGGGGSLIYHRDPAARWRSMEAGDVVTGRGLDWPARDGRRCGGPT